MLSHLANRIHPYSTWVHVAYYVSILPRTSCPVSLSGTWIGRGFPLSCLHIPLYFVLFLKVWISAYLKWVKHCFFQKKRLCRLFLFVAVIYNKIAQYISLHFLLNGGSMWNLPHRVYLQEYGALLLLARQNLSKGKQLGCFHRCAF